MIHTLVSDFLRSFFVQILALYFANCAAISLTVPASTTRKIAAQLVRTALRIFTKNCNHGLARSVL